jgi:enterochelin esterase-like enzyme
MRPRAPLSPPTRDTRLLIRPGFVRWVLGSMLFLTWSIAAAAPAVPKTDEALRTITFKARVPENTGTLYITGDQPELGDWNPRGLAMKGSGQERTAVLHLRAGTHLEYKFTLGSWDREALGANGAVPPNSTLDVTTNQNVEIVITAFRQGIAEYLDDWRGSGVIGRLEYWRDVPSKHLAPTRNVEIWLPPDYDTDATNRYDVLYMHDGQNLFDPRLASTGVDWGVDEAVMRGRAAKALPPIIVVGVWCTDERSREYSPWDLGTNYAAFLIEELMPKVNARFRTRTGPEHTAVMGSSMGGLISFWLCWKYPQTFGLAGCLSTHFPWNGEARPSQARKEPLIEREIRSGATVPHGIRFYFDYGTLTIDSSYEPIQNKVNAWLSAQGLKEGEDFVARKFEGAGHNEAAWRARLDEPLKFLFGRAAKTARD